MNLSRFNLDEEIYIDSNIFLYAILKNPTYLHSCRTFLTNVENGNVKAIISPFVLDEVAYKIIVENLKTRLGLKSTSKVLQKLSNEPILIEQVKAELTAFIFIIMNYKGLKTPPIPSSIGTNFIKHIMEYNLLPRDAMHMAVISHYKIKHIATNDSHFDTIPGLKVWKP